MRVLLFLSGVFLASIGISQTFEPFQGVDKKFFQFDFEKNFYSSQIQYLNAYKASVKEINDLTNSFRTWRSRGTPLQELLRQYNQAEYRYRTIDLYLFLRYAINTNDHVADHDSDSLRNAVRQLRTNVRQTLNSLSNQEAGTLVSKSPEFAHYIQKVREEKLHALSAESEAILKPFNYLRDGGYYFSQLRQVEFDSLQTPDGWINVADQMSAWQNSNDSTLRRKGSQLLFKGYNSKRNEIAQGYIEMIKGLNAFARSKNYASLIEEKLAPLNITEQALNKIFEQVIAGKKKEQSIVPVQMEKMEHPRFSISEGINMVSQSLRVLGKEYSEELNALLKPGNGRIDVVPGDNRLPMRGTASVFPVKPSVFYAANYTGYLLDITILAHEAGHAVQAALMQKNKVPMVYATGPGFFTESFGNFNELLLFENLRINARSKELEALYNAQLNERLSVLFGSAEEAYVEYKLVSAILSGKANSADDLDRITSEAGSAFSNALYQSEPERKALWLVLESNYLEPLHNINDMLASALSIKYFEAFKNDPGLFASRYLALLKHGYSKHPEDLLKPLNINLNDSAFIPSVIGQIIRMKQ